jgi:hypothetical protein
MSSIAGFAVGALLARDLDREEQARLGLVGGLMPSPLLAAVVVDGLLSREDEDDNDGGDDGGGNDVGRDVGGDDVGQPVRAVPPELMREAVEAELQKDLASARRDTALVGLAETAIEAIRSEVMGGDQSASTRTRTTRAKPVSAEKPGDADTS